jgi:uncharacterized OB-fold protein
MSLPRMLPYVKDRDTQGFFDAARERRLVFRACLACNKGLHPPTSHCPYCGSGNTHWREAVGRGRLHSWTTVTHAIHPGYTVPYTVVLVQLDDCPEVRLVGRLDGAPQLVAGMPMQVWFETVGEGIVLPQWRPL